MDVRQKATVDKHRKEIIGCLEPRIDHALIDFTEDGAGPSELCALTVRDIQIVRTKQTPYAQTMELLSLLKQHENGFRALKAALIHYGMVHLAAMLEEESRNKGATWTRQQLAAVQEKERELLNALSKSRPWTWFQSKGYITTEDVENIQKDQRATQKVNTLLAVLSRATNGWHGLTTYLVEHNHERLNSALKEAVRQFSEELSTMAKQSSSSELASFRQFLRNWTIKECELIKKQWMDTLNVTGFEIGYVHLNFADNISAAHFSKAEFDNFQFLFGPEKRIIISADPGMGKSTILHKIAHDWATGENDKLSKEFDQVFLVRLGSAKGETICDLIEYELDSTACGKFITDCLEHPLVTFKTLLLLDALDELKGVASVAVKQLLNMEALKVVKCVISTRTSHVDRIPRKHLWFQIEGFGLAEQQEFIRKELKDSPAADRMMTWYSNMHELAKRPLFLTIACVLAQHKQESHTEFAMLEASVLFELVKHYYEWLFYIAKNVKGLTVSQGEFTSAMIESGKLAFKTVIRQQTRSLLHPLSLGIKPRAPDPTILELAARLGIVTKQLKKKNSMHDIGVEPYSFIHQLFAEYLCAFELSTRCQKPESSIFNTWATMRQGKGFSADRLANALNLRHSPVSYFLTGLSADYAEAAIMSGHLSKSSHHYLLWCCDVLLSDVPGCKNLNYTMTTRRFGPLQCSKPLAGGDLDKTTLVSTNLLQSMCNAGVLLLTLWNIRLDRRWLSLRTHDRRILLVGCILPAESEQPIDKLASFEEVYLSTCRVENFRWMLFLPLTILGLYNVETADWAGLAAALTALADRLLEFGLEVGCWSESQVSPAEMCTLLVPVASMKQLRALYLRSNHITENVLGVLTCGNLAACLKNLFIVSDVMTTHSCAGLKTAFPLLEFCIINHAHNCLAE